MFVERKGDLISMNFPTTLTYKIPHNSKIANALGLDYLELYESTTKFMAIYDSESSIASLAPNFNDLAALHKNIIVTAPGDKCDFVSRFFAPAAGINEDPVTGSAHTALTPYWANRLNKTILEARQISSRGGELSCELKNNRVIMIGAGQQYMIGEINI